MAERPRIDPDVDLHLPADRSELPAQPAAVLGAIAAGGVVGALVRAGVQEAFPNPTNAFPWATFGVNVSGCLLIGVLMVLVGQVWADRPLVRPFLGVGMLGGFTTFSAYVLDIQRAVDAGAVPTALTYLTATLIGALVAVWLGEAGTGWLLDRTASDSTRAGNRGDR